MPELSPDRNTGCCGLSAVRGFVNEQEPYRLGLNGFQRLEYDRGETHMVMATVTDHQFEESPHHIQALLEAGFRIVGRWRNRSSHRFVNLLVNNRRHPDNLELPAALRPLLSAEMTVAMGAGVPQARVVEAPAPEPVMHWRLERLRFDDETGVVNERITAHQWNSTRRPTPAVIAQRVAEYRNGRGARWRFEVKQYPVE